MTKYRSTAIAVDVSVETYTDTPIVNPRSLHRRCGNTQSSRKAAIGVKGAATTLISRSDMARFVIKRLVIDCIGLHRRTTYIIIVLPIRLRVIMIA